MKARSLEDVLFDNPDARGKRLIALGTSLASIVLIGLAVLIVLQFRDSGQLEARYWHFFLWPSTWSFLGWGLLGTLASAAMAALIALSVGLLLMAGRMSRVLPLRWLSTALIEFMRGVPTLLLVYFCFLVLPSLGFKMSSYWMVTLPVGLSTAGVVAEVYRSGLLAVPRGQGEAAASLALSPWQSFYFVSFPQALRYVLPSLVAQMVIIVKDTTFGYVVTYPELIQKAKVMVANYDSLVPVYLIVGLIYCLINYAITRLARNLGNRSPANKSQSLKNLGSVQ